MSLSQRVQYWKPDCIPVGGMRMDRPFHQTIFPGVMKNLMVWEPDYAMIDRIWVETFSNPCELHQSGTILSSAAKDITPSAIFGLVIYDLEHRFTLRLTW